MVAPVIPVEQRQMAIFDERGDNVQRGDCLTACIASLFELPIDDVPFFVDMENWWGEYNNWLHDRGLQLGQVRLSTVDDDPTRLNGHPTEGIYWIATVKSPRSKARCNGCKGTGQSQHEEGPCGWCGESGLVPSLHAVVMCGGELVWDPHPQRDMGHLGFVSGEWFVVRDPARLVRV